jgi:hypothetical protein
MMPGMERKRMSGGKLKSAGYDRERRILEIEMTDGRLVEYANVGDEIARRFMTSTVAWSYFRDNIDEEFPSQVVGRSALKPSDPNPFE